MLGAGGRGVSFHSDWHFLESAGVRSDVTLCSSVLSCVQSHMLGARAITLTVSVRSSLLCAAVQVLWQTYDEKEFKYLNRDTPCGKRALFLHKSSNVEFGVGINALRARKDKEGIKDTLSSRWQEFKVHP